MISFLKIITFLVLVSFALIYGTVKPVFALTSPSFPACSNPQGSVKVSYSSGTHGIVGDSKDYTGSDTVYKLNDDTLTQCFCSNDGSGVQTNWWKVTSLTESEIQALKNLGWFFVPNGSLWGLDDAPYMAQNSSYACKGASAGSGGSNSSSDSGQGGVGGGSVLGAVDVLGLASTGNISLLYSLFGTGIISLLLGFALRKKS